MQFPVLGLLLVLSRAEPSIMSSFPKLPPSQSGIAVIDASFDGATLPTLFACHFVEKESGDGLARGHDLEQLNVEVSGYTFASDARIASYTIMMDQGSQIGIYLSEIRRVTLNARQHSQKR
jgi:hypothetical protein